MLAAVSRRRLRRARRDRPIHRRARPARAFRDDSAFWSAIEKPVSHQLRTSSSALMTMIAGAAMGAASNRARRCALRSRWRHRYRDLVHLPPMRNSAGLEHQAHHVQVRAVD